MPNADGFCSHMGGAVVRSGARPSFHGWPTVKRIDLQLHNYISGVARGRGPWNKIRMVGNGGPITGCLIHGVTKYTMGFRMLV